MAFATTTLVLSVVGLASLIGFKWWEERTGRLVMPRARARMEEKVRAGFSLAKEKIPGLLARLLVSWFQFTREAAKRALARALLLSEEALERVLRNLRRAERKHRGGEASSFLKEVAEHKKQLRERDLTLE